jgi:phosphatidate cytidylyltransferase
MADDKSGDDVFEDLDKFFAPIKDLDWDEPEAPAEPVAPGEGHVQVIPPDSANEDAAMNQEQTSASPPDETATPTKGAEDSVEVIDEADSEPEEDADLGALEAIVLEEEAEGPMTPGQTDLFTNDQPQDNEADQDEALQPEPEEAPERYDTEPIELGEADQDESVEEPSDEELEAATEHFAGSVREGVRISPFEDEADEEPTGDEDLLAELGAEEPDGSEAEQEILSDLDRREEEPQTVVVGPDGLRGPSWQEPSAVEVGAEVDRRGAGERDVPAAFLTGLLLAAVAVVALLAGDVWFAIVAGLVVLAAQGEFFGVLVKHHRQPATAVGLVTGVLIVAGAYLHGEGAMLAMFALGTVATFLWYLTVPAAHRKDVIGNIGLTLLNLAWIPLLGGYLVALLDVRDGRSLILAIIALTFVFDTSAFLIGSIWGGSFLQRPLASETSPRKSYEGFIGATLVTVIVSVVLVTAFVERFDALQLEAALLGLVVSLAATFGDLAESLVKRDLGVKDMGTLLPGHGGLLDRIDSLLFVAPASFLLLRILFA